MVQSVVETDITNVTHLAIHTKLPAFKTVIAMILLWNRAQEQEKAKIWRLKKKRELKTGMPPKLYP